MALEIQGTDQITQDGKYFWLTENAGIYDVASNPGGWGVPNENLSQSALLAFVYRMTNPVEILTPVGSQLKYNAAATNTEETAFQFNYDSDGYHQFNLVRLPVSSDDANSLDDTPVVFTIGDVWYNTIDGSVKQLTAGGIVVLDITLSTDLDLILAATNVVTKLCENVYFGKLAIKKNLLYNEMILARRKKNDKQEERKRNDQMTLILGMSSALYQFYYGLKIESQNTVEDLIDNYL